MKKVFLVCLLGFVLCSLSVAPTSAAQSVNKAWSEEYFSLWWKYDGTAQFVPSYKIPANPGYSLTSGKKVKQSYVNFTRKKSGTDASVIGGRKYSRTATSQTTNAVYAATATATDSLNIFTNKTRFWYGWTYF